MGQIYFSLIFYDEDDVFNTSVREFGSDRPGPPFEGREGKEGGPGRSLYLSRKFFYFSNAVYFLTLVFAFPVSLAHIYLDKFVFFPNV